VALSSVMGQYFVNNLLIQAESAKKIERHHKKIQKTDKIT
jgi:hypothetical protein